MVRRGKLLRPAWLLLGFLGVWGGLGCAPAWYEVVPAYYARVGPPSQERIHAFRPLLGASGRAIVQKSDSGDLVVKDPKGFDHAVKVSEFPIGVNDVVHLVDRSARQHRVRSMHLEGDTLVGTDDSRERTFRIPLDDVVAVQVKRHGAWESFWEWLGGAKEMEEVYKPARE